MNNRNNYDSWEWRLIEMRVRELILEGCSQKEAWRIAEEEYEDSYAEDGDEEF